jgi:hypothetical protein
MKKKTSKKGKVTAVKTAKKTKKAVTVSKAKVTKVTKAKVTREKPAITKQTKKKSIVGKAKGVQAKISQKATMDYPKVMKMLPGNQLSLREPPQVSLPKNFVYDLVESDKYFVTQEGVRLGNLKELALHLEDMGDDVYNTHANEEKNDFANWIKDCMNEHELANDLHGKDKQGAQVSIMKHVLNQL